MFRFHNRAQSYKKFRIYASPHAFFIIFLDLICVYHFFLLPLHSNLLIINCQLSIINRQLSIINCQHINKSFGSQRVLNDVTLEIPAGQVVGLLGPNGAGKSTLMKILMGLWKPDSGTVSVPASIGYLPENNPLYDEMYVTEYLEFMAGLTNRQIVKSSKRQIVNGLIDLVGLTPERHKHIRELSKGYRQRVGLAQALIGNPELLILDEPTTGLDPNQLIEIRALIKSLTHSSSNPSVILSTHIMQEVREMCDRVIILDHGTIKADKMINEIDDLEALFHTATTGNLIT